MAQKSERSDCGPPGIRDQSAPKFSFGAVQCKNIIKVPESDPELLEFLHRNSIREEEMDKDEPSQDFSVDDGVIFEEPSKAGVDTQEMLCLMDHESQIFDHWEEPTKDSSPEKERTLSLGFRTGNGSRVSPVSEDALKRARHLWSDPSQDSSPPVRRASLGVPKSRLLGKSPNPFNVSKEALERARTLFQDCSSEIPLSGPSPRSESNVSSAQIVNADPRLKAHGNVPAGSCENKVPAFVGFSTGRGDQVKVSEKALAQAKLLWDRCQEEEKEGIELESHKDKTSLPRGVDHTGKNDKPLAGISARDSCNMDGDTDPRLSDPSGAPKEGECFGFKTASGTQVDVSQEALHRAQRLWSEVKDDSIPAKPMPNAGGKFKISTESMNKALSLWKDSEKGDENIPGDSDHKERKTSPPPLARPSTIPQGLKRPVLSDAGGTLNPSPNFRSLTTATPTAKTPLADQEAGTALTPVSSRSRQLGVRRRPGSLGRGFKTPTLTKKTIDSGTAVGASPDLASVAASAPKRPRLSFNAPRHSMGKKDNEVDSQEFEEEILDFLENQKL